MSIPDIIHASLPLKEYISSYHDVERFMPLCRDCNNYNKCWSCPPYTFDVGQLLASYTHIDILAIKISLPSEQVEATYSAEQSRSIISTLMFEARKELDAYMLNLEHSTPHSLALYAGSCTLCPAQSCTRSQNQPCLHPEAMRYSLESIGFDVARTTSTLLNIELKWGQNGQLPEYITLVSALLS